MEFASLTPNSEIKCRNTFPGILAQVYLNYCFHYHSNFFITQTLQQNLYLTGHKDVYYFLNLDRCAYFGDVGPVRDYSSGTYKSIGGGKVLSINFNCSTVYWYGLHPNDTEAGFNWYPYVSAQGLECKPKPPYD